MAPIPQTPAKNLRFLDFPLLYRFERKGMMLFIRFIPVLKRKWHFTKNGHALLAISDFRQTPAKNLRFLGFPLLYRFSIKGMMLFLRFIPVLKRKWRLKKGCREQGSLPSLLKLKLLRRADCELFRLHGRVLRRRGTRLLLPLADSLLRRLLSLRAHPPHQTVYRRHPR